MHNRDRALDFLKHFCAGDVDALAALLADDLQFTGPLFQFNSRAAYLKSLRDDPSEPCGYRILSVTDSDDSVAVFYDYEKPSGTLAPSQLNNSALLHLVLEHAEVSRQDLEGARTLSHSLTFLSAWLLMDGVSRVK